MRATDAGAGNGGLRLTGIGPAARALGGGGGAFEPGRTNFGRSEGGEYLIIEPFLARWIEREQEDYGVAARLRAEPSRNDLL